MKKNLLFLLAFICLFTVACSKDNGGGLDRNSVVYYSSSDGKIIEPYLTDYAIFGARIKSITDSAIIFDAPVTSIGGRAFYNCATLVSVSIPASVTSIGEYAFCRCQSLVEATIPENVTWIGEYAFYRCRELENVVIPDGVTSIRDCAFADCVSLKSITIPDGVTSIGNSAFNSTYLESITIGSGVTSIGVYAFANSGWDVKVYCKPTTPPTGNEGMFFGCGSAKFYVPRNSVDAYKSAEYWSDWADNIEGYDF